MEKKKKSWIHCILPIAVGLTLSSITAQEKENQAIFKQPKNIIELSTEVHSKSAQQTATDTQSLFANYLKLAKGNTHIPIQQKTDALGFTFEKCKQLYKGIPVEFGTATLSRKNGKAVTIHGEYYNVTNVQTVPKISAGLALQKAMAHIGAQKYAWEDTQTTNTEKNTKPAGDLLILPDLDSKNEQGVVTKFNLAYKFKINSLEPMNHVSIYIDASTGKTLSTVSAIHMAHANDSSSCDSSTSNTIRTRSVLEKTTNTEKNKAAAMFVDGMADTQYSGRRTISTTFVRSTSQATPDQYILHDQTRGNGIRTFDARSGTVLSSQVEFTDNDNNWTETEHTSAQLPGAHTEGALDVHWGLGEVYDYFNTVHRRNGYDGQGGTIRAFANYKPRITGPSFDNAIAFPPNTLAFGNRSFEITDPITLTFREVGPFTTIDLVAHEFTHLLTSNAFNLNYTGETRAISEGLSDIFAAAIEHHVKGNRNDANPSDNTWIFVDEAPNRANTTGLRSLSNPKSFNNPDTFNGTNYRNAGVHGKGVLLGHWFYLLTEGSAGTDGINDSNQRFTVRGIGIDKASKIVYRAINQYLTSNATFITTRDAMIRAARDLHREGSAEVLAVTEAWKAVGLQTTTTSTPQPTCSDRLRNGTETGVDCGGTCRPCSNTPTPSGGNVVFVDMADKTANATDSWKSFRIQAGDNTNFGAWFTQNKLRLVANNKDVVGTGTENISFLGEGTQVGSSSNFITNPRNYLLSDNSHTTWRGRSGYIGFRFRINNQVHYGWLHATVSTDGLSYTITDYAYNETAGEGLTTTRNTAKSSSTTDQAFSIAPNPITDGVLNIFTEKKDIKEYKVVNILGQTVQKGSFANTISVAKLKAGIYILNINNTSKRFVIE